MKILAFTDIHANRTITSHIVKKANKADLLVCTGDVTNFGGGAEETLRELNKAKKPLLIIHGNHEMEEPFRKLCKKFSNIIFLHKASYEVGNLIFFGFGGGGFAFRELEFEKISKEFMKTIDKEKKVILMTHAPPFNTQIDYLDFAGHRGCKSYREFIDKYQPLLALSGHFHETFGKMEYIKKTLVMNPSPVGRIIQI